MGEDRPVGLTRREFLAGGAAFLGGLALGGRRLLRRSLPPAITGSIIGASAAAGHRLREGSFPKPARTARAGIVIVGGGIAGLSAGWKLLRSGFRDFVLLDLEPDAGGNSRWGRNAVSAYPWGAHYVPFPTPESTAVHELFRELGVEAGRGADARPVYEDRYVCFAPTERIYLHGRWQEGLFPRVGAGAEDLRQYGEFEKAMAAFRRRRGSDGRRAFAIPMEKSSRDPALLKLDQMSMAEYLERQGWSSPRLRWFVEYACRDDYGCGLADTSAWAGAHYFASRGEGDEDQVLTWPEGNGFIVKRLEEILDGRLRPQCLAFRVEPDPEGVRADFLDLRTGRAERIVSRAAIVCAPQFVAARLVPGLAGRGESGAFQYSPWVVANLTLENPPEGRGAPPAWDNVLFESDSLGYVVATHQSLSQDQRSSVWTYYLPLWRGEPAARRGEALAASWSHWRDVILKDLSRAHKELPERVRHIDVMVWGHAMVRPAPGFIWGGARERAASPLGDIFFGHSDLSGFSLFEEAQHRGIAAAEAALARLGLPFRSSL